MCAHGDSTTSSNLNCPTQILTAKNNENCLAWPFPQKKRQTFLNLMTLSELNCDLESGSMFPNIILEQFHNVGWNHHWSIHKQKNKFWMSEWLTGAISISIQCVLHCRKFKTPRKKMELGMWKKRNYFLKKAQNFQNDCPSMQFVHMPILDHCEWVTFSPWDDEIQVFESSNFWRD